MTGMLLGKSIRLASFLLLCGATGFGGVINYQGRLSIDGTNFTGQGWFVFSLQDTNGMILWNSGVFPALGGTNRPPGVRTIPVRDGRYHVRLGDEQAGMPALDAKRILAANDPFLRVWFSDGLRGWEIASGDTPIKSLLRQSPVAQAPANPGTTLNGNQADEILKELRALREKVEKLSAIGLPMPSAPKRQIVTVPLGGSPTLGAADAPLVLVEFTDYQCPDCRRANDGVLRELKKKYVESGKLLFVSRNLPLAIHSNAEPAAHAALCAMLQNQFWAMRDKLFAINTALTRENFLKAAGELKLEVELFRGCFDGKTFASQIGRDVKDAAAAGIAGTPAFVLGRKSGDNVTGVLLLGEQPLSRFEAEMEQQLADR